MDFKTIVDTLFQNKRGWTDITNKEKENFFFIFNRYMSKKYPRQAQFFNDKYIDKATAFDIWFNFFSTEVRTPYWFWKGATKKKDPEIKDWQLVRDFHEMGLNDIYLLCEMFPKEFKEEIKRITLINKEIAK